MKEDTENLWGCTWGCTLPCFHNRKTSDRHSSKDTCFCCATAWRSSFGELGGKLGPHRMPPEPGLAGGREEGFWEEEAPIPELVLLQPGTPSFLSGRTWVRDVRRGWRELQETIFRSCSRRFTRSAWRARRVRSEGETEKLAKKDTSKIPRRKFHKSKRAGRSRYSVAVTSACQAFCSRVSATFLLKR